MAMKYRMRYNLTVGWNVTLTNATSCMCRSRRCTACVPGTCTYQCRRPTHAPGSQYCAYTCTHVIGCFLSTRGVTFRAIRVSGIQD